MHKCNSHCGGNMCGLRENYKSVKKSKCGSQVAHPLVLLLLCLSIRRNGNVLLIFLISNIKQRTRHYHCHFAICNHKNFVMFNRELCNAFIRFNHNSLLLYLQFSLAPTSYNTHENVQKQTKEHM